MMVLCAVTVCVLAFASLSKKHFTIYEDTINRCQLLHMSSFAFGTQRMAVTLLFTVSI